MPSGNPGKRRGARGSNASKKTSAKKAASKKSAPKADDAPTPAPSGGVDDFVAAVLEGKDRRRRMVNEAMKSCRLKNPGARDIAAQALERQLLHADVLEQRAREGTITSEEGAVLNANHRGQLKWLQMMGVDALRGEDDCEVCNGEATIDGEECEACQGSGVRE